MTSTAPLVSVIIPAHNAERTLDRALKSVWRQSYSNLEVIVVDDASSDRTSTIAVAGGETNLRLVKLATNHGVAGARNAGIANAQGEFVAFLDADDEWLPEKISRQVAAMQASEQLSFVTCSASLVSETGEVKDLVNAGRPPVTGPHAWRTLLAYTFVATPCVMVRRSILLKSGGFDPKLPVAEDQDLWIRLARLGDVGYVSEVLVLVHDTPGSLTKGNAANELRFLVPMVLRHVEAFRADLDDNQVRFILRNRFGQAGRNAFGRGLFWEGLQTIFRAVANGDSLINNLRFILANSIVGRLLRRTARN